MTRILSYFKWLLIPLSFIYGIIVYIRNLMFDLNILPSKEFDIPIISVGNITVGGTGKTPHVEYLITLLKDDFKIATLSRGYKRKSKGYILSDKNATVKLIGDEPMQIKGKFPDILVAVDNKRVNGVKKLLASEKGEDLDAILLDDAFQHRYIAPGISILLIDYNRPLNKDFILPYGRLRENPHERNRANIIIVSKSPETLSPIDRRIMVKRLNILPYQTLYFTTIRYGNLQAVFPEKAINVITEEWRKENFSILLVTGIANPAPIRKYLNDFSDHIEEITFSDHHVFTKEDIRQIHKKFREFSGENKIIITTEKDAVRFKDMEITDELIHKHLFYIPVMIHFMNGDKPNFNEQILNYVRKNKRTSNLHKNKNIKQSSE